MNWSLVSLSKSEFSDKQHQLIDFLHLVFAYLIDVLGFDYETLVIISILCFVLFSIQYISLFWWIVQQFC